MTPDEAHADLQAALAEEDENRTESIRTMALVVIALELREARERPLPLPLPYVPHSRDQLDLAGLETHGKQGRERGR